MKVYQYYLTHVSSTSVYPEWYGVYHGADIQVKDHNIHLKI